MQSMFWLAQRNKKKVWRDKWNRKKMKQEGQELNFRLKKMREI